MADPPSTAANTALPAMRLDRYLWFARLVKSRSAAQALAEAGRLRLNGRVIDRSAAPVRAGDVLTFALNDRVRAIRVLLLPRRRGPPAEGRACYAELSGQIAAGRAPKASADD